jgi:hypothetical protein
MLKMKTLNNVEFKHLYGKKVQCICEGKLCVGILEFAGINKLHDKFQVTLNRTPYWPVNPDTIKLF